MENSINWHDVIIGILNFLSVNALGIIISLTVILALGRVIILITNKYIQEDELRHSIHKWTRYLTLIVAVLWLLVLYNYHTRQGTPFYLFIIGVFLAGVAISMRDVFSNFVGWTIVVSSKGFKQGDRIKVGDLTGDVIDIGILRTTLAEIGGWVDADQSTGRLVSVPNSKMLSNEIYNYTQGYDFIWNEMKVLVTFESDWVRAEEIMTEIGQDDFRQKKEQIQERLRNVRSRYLLRYNYISPKVYVRIGESGVELALRYMVRARRRRTVEDTLSRNLLLRFKQEPNIEFAYPTLRVYRLGEEQGEKIPSS
ncbi:MAG: mechanosensitive ion channel family protein [Chitinispirillaceae bacterium]